ncbi:MAG: amidohydrolase [Candidatus Bathyarchaeota archaeon]|nr:MAG: amidohydrolase [Candidatus Bathyarchaeota archaeon]
MIKKLALQWLEKNKAKFNQISDRIWDYAELGLQEVKSAALLASELEKAGFQVVRGVADMPTAFVATYGEGKPVIGFLGEYDALSDLSQKPIPQRDPVVEGAPGHGCGHNVHGTSGTAATIAVKEVMEKQNIQGTIKFFGCPAEETLVGKVFMVRDGVFDGVDTIFSHHPGSMNAAQLESSNAMNSVKFQFYGVASHAGGSPHRGRSALDAVELMNIGVNFMREHIIQEARIHYIIEKGGGAPNIVPAQADSWYFVRAPLRDQVNHIYRWILKIAEGATLMTQTTYEYKLLTGCYNLLSVPSLADLVVKNMREIGAPEYTVDENKFAQTLQATIPPQNIIAALKRSKRHDWRKLQGVTIDTSIPDPWGSGDVMGGSTDVGDVSWQTPTIEFTTATFALGLPGHSWQKVAMGTSSIAHKSLLFAAKTMACCALDTLTNPSLLQKITTEWITAKQEEEYVCPLPLDLKPPLDQFPTN